PYGGKCRKASDAVVSTTRLSTQGREFAISQPVVEPFAPRTTHEIVPCVDTTAQNLVRCGNSGVRSERGTLKCRLSVGRNESPEGELKQGQRARENWERWIPAATWRESRSAGEAEAARTPLTGW